MYIKILLVIIALTGPNYSQSWEHYFTESKFNLNTINTPIPDSLKDQILKSFNYSHPNYSDFKSLKDHFIFFDFSGDGLLDIIYNDNFGAESNLIVFLKNTGNNFVEIFNGWGNIAWIGTNIPWTAKKFIIYDFGCCGDTRNYIEEYVPTIVDDSLKYQLSFKVILPSGIQIPKKFFTTPITFLVKKQNYNLRIQPQIKNEVFETEWGNSKGNIIVTFKQGTVGKALAESEDETGRIWWFVIIDKHNKKEWEFYTAYQSFNSKEIPSYAGWMSSSYLEAIYEQSK